MIPQLGGWTEALYLNCEKLLRSHYSDYSDYNWRNWETDANIYWLWTSDTFPENKGVQCLGKFVEFYFLSFCIDQLKYNLILSLKYDESVYHPFPPHPLLVIKIISYKSQQFSPLLQPCERFNESLSKNEIFYYKEQ